MNYKLFASGMDFHAFKVHSISELYIFMHTWKQCTTWSKKGLKNPTKKTHAHVYIACIIMEDSWIHVFTMNRLIKAQWLHYSKLKLMLDIADIFFQLITAHNRVQNQCIKNSSRKKKKSIQLNLTCFNKQLPLWSLISRIPHFQLTSTLRQHVK